MPLVNDVDPNKTAPPPPPPPPLKQPLQDALPPPPPPPTTRYETSAIGVNEEIVNPPSVLPVTVNPALFAVADVLVETPFKV